MKYLKFIIAMTLLMGIAFSAGAFDPDKEEAKPDSHRAGWNFKHQGAAKADPSSCQMCHKPFFCVDCHERRDTITQRVHKRNFKFYHSIEARTNPRKCDSCHKISFCTSCHSNPR